MPIYSLDNSYISYAIGNDLTAFDNAYAPLVAGECQATDLLDIDLNRIAIDYSDPLVKGYHGFSAAQAATQYTTSYKTAIVSIPMFLQSGAFAGATLGGISTGAGPPYTHTITLASSQTPLFLAFHWEKELASQDLRYDFFGHMPHSWRVYCNDSDNWKAKQILTAHFAVSDGTASDLAEPAKSTLPLYEWNDFKHASGALAFTYNSNPLEMDITGFDVNYTRIKKTWGSRNSSGFPSAAYVSGLDLSVKLTGYITGDNIRTIMATKPESYAGALAGQILGYKSASAQFDLQWDKLYMKPAQDILSTDNWHEKKTIELIQHGTTVSLAPEDSLDKTYYENN